MRKEKLKKEIISELNDTILELKEEIISSLTDKVINRLIKKLPPDIIDHINKIEYSKVYTEPKAKPIEEIKKDHQIAMEEHSKKFPIAPSVKPDRYKDGGYTLDLQMGARKEAIEKLQRQKARERRA